jgi:hypothetical protein
MATIDPMQQALLGQIARPRQDGRRSLASSLMRLSPPPAPINNAGAGLAYALTQGLQGYMGGRMLREEDEREQRFLDASAKREYLQGQEARQFAEQFGMGGMPGAPAAPAPTPVGPAPAMPPAPPRGDAPAAVAQGIAARRGLDPDAPDYPQQIMAINNGVVGATMPGQRPQPVQAEAAPQRPAGPPNWQQIAAAAAFSNNPAIQRFGSLAANIMQREDTQAARQEEIRLRREMIDASRPPRAQAPTYEVVTPEQAAQLGLPPAPDGRAFQRNTQTGQISVIGGGGVTVNNPGENALIRADVDTIKAQNEAANQARTLTQLFDRAGEAIRATPEGAGAQFAPIVGQVARTLGIDIPGTSEAEILRSITAQLAPLQRVPGSGATSDRDIALFLQAVPRLGNTREGNLALVDMGRRLAQRRIEEAGLWRRHVGQPDLMDRLNALPPLFTDEERAFLRQAPPPPAGVGIALPGVQGPGGMTLDPPAQQPAMPRITNPADAARLPPGTRFVDPNGVTREVPRR